MHQKIFDKLVEEESAPIVTHNVFTDLNSSCPIVSDRHGEALQYGAGFDLAALQLEVTDLSLLRYAAAHLCSS